MSRSLDEIVSTLRRAGLVDDANEAQSTLSDPVDTEVLDRFCAAHGLSKQSLVDSMGGSP
ncbi:MAG: hypothetical protein ABSA93_31320 [Streptosporangiaceae bacterium]|jgi:hypothetical protein